MIDISPTTTNVRRHQALVIIAPAAGHRFPPWGSQSPRNQGISVNYGDTYVKWLGGQYFVLTGRWTSVIRRVTTGGHSDRGEPTLYANPVQPMSLPGSGDRIGHALQELDYSNNVECRISIPGHPEKGGPGRRSGSRG